MFKVLIVDDEQNIRQRLINNMPWRDHGFEVVDSVASGENAWRSVQNATPHVVLTDILMPGMTGLELIGLIHKQFPYVKTAIMSAYDDFKYAQDAIRLGVKGYLLKPVVQEEFEDLFATIARELLAFSGNKATKSPSEQNIYVSEAIRYIGEHYTERIRLEDVAEHLHLNPNYFSSLFKRETGTSFIDYVNEIRIRHAMELLLNTDEKIGDISVSVGFFNFSYFNKLFKRITGVTPQVYQKSNGFATKPTKVLFP